ncbi:ATP-dependent helicase HrpB [Hydrogenovibrio sp. 3SP14C1]|uniref:ATP-dependent helicase HrpB n=1 Tax=Hydrogenovibrio sp. 3SP14C1 TaxID=3038774 RepID=UPI002417A7D7|nr:ATP-dependent helicase HrpB [Hydrogenovibrio sp. 3SP14C1]MDG4811790.1 ATP-dependent helicase HrpB [Hydrogenovibrio sp. 3SP14C1]
MKELPIQALLPELKQDLKSHHNVILQAEPGAGKSTAVPLALLESDWLAGRKIIMLEPRRLAVKSIAYYLASQLGEQVGQRIGYQIRNDRKSSSETVLEIVTEGILTRRLQADPELSDVGLIIFDEFHERSIHADLSLALCLEVQSALRGDLKLLIMSATMNLTHLQALFEQASKSVSLLQSAGRTFPVSVSYLTSALKSSHPADWIPALQSLIRKAIVETEQDILVFLSGQGDIQRVQHQLESSLPQEIVVLPLYGGLKQENQEVALLPDAEGRRKIVLSTNLAETSLTIEGVGAVVDSGFARKALYDISSGMTTLTTQRISQASAEQRKGRAGRLFSGKCYRLWTESQQAQLLPFDEPEIKQSDLSDLCLELAQWGVFVPDELQWLTVPPKPHYEAAKTLLVSLGLLSETGALTDLGQKSMAFGLPARLAKMLLVSDQVTHLNQEAAQVLACDVAAILAERDVLSFSEGTDLVKRVLALQAYRLNRKQAEQQYHIQRSAMEQAARSSKNWQQKIARNADVSSLSLADLQLNVGVLVAMAYPDRLAQKRRGGGARYVMRNGKGVCLREEDSLQSSPWLAVAAVDGKRQDGQVYLAAPVTLEDIKRLFFEHIKHEKYYRFDEGKKEITGSEQVRLGKLLLEEKTLLAPNEDAIHNCLLAAIEKDLSLLPWHKKVQAWLNRVRWLSQYNDDFPNFSQAWLKSNLTTWLLPYLNGITSVKALQNLDLLMLLQAQLPYELQQSLEQQAPRNYETPSHKMVPIEYEGHPKVSVVLQEVFGELDSPKLAWGKVPLMFELLSPARRPIQVTSDLANFWQTSYFEVKKEMKGRYPKHRWPDKPLEEKAGRSIKTCS